MIKIFLKGLLILAMFTGISLVFFYKVFWSELFFDRSTVGAVNGETQATEWGMQNIYDNLKQHKNPFSPVKSILYPFGLDVVGSDAGFAFNYLFTRPFLSAHQSLAVIVVLNLILASCGMYMFLRLMDITSLPSFFAALAYGNMTFMTVRLAHVGYSVIYLFPWFFYFCLSFIKAKKTLWKIVSSLLVPFVFAMTLWQNMYYFIILSVSCVFFTVYILVYNRRKLFLFIKKNVKYFLLAGFVFISLLIPWLKVLYQTLLFSEVPRGMGWNGAIEFSSDLVGILIPSAYNYYYGAYISKFASNIPFIKSIFEGFNYPGIIILVTYSALVIYQKRLPKKISENIRPYLQASILFFILTLGPFLHIAGHWSVPLEEKIRIVLPLPFIILHYVPFIGNIRAPGRLSVGMIFFAYIAVAYLINYFLKGKSRKFLVVFSVLMLSVIIFDQRPVDKLSDLPYAYPKKIYSYVKQDNNFLSVLEIPFSIRDGFTYFGDFNSISTVGQLIYKKPIVTGYAGRIPDYVKEYYQEDPFIGYLGRIIDLNIKDNPIVNTLDPDNWKNPDIKGSLQTIDFLDIKYVIFRENNRYKQKIEDFLGELGYRKIMADVNNYVLYSRVLSNSEFLDIDPVNDADRSLLGMGWYGKEETFRWANRRSSVMFKTGGKKKFILHFEAASYFTSIPMKIFINRKLAGQLTLDPSLKEYKIKINQADVEEGINTLYFFFARSYQPVKVVPGSLDQRQLSGKFRKIWLDDK